MKKLSRRFLNQEMAVLINGAVITVVLVRASIEEEARIFGELTQEEAQVIADSINRK
jgi:preprotein translocase subunit SecD